MIRTPLLIALLMAAAPALAQVAPTAPALRGPTQQVRPAAMSQETVDINTATVDQLAAIKGVGRTTAEAIVKGRPYANTEELTKKKILPPGVFAQVKDQLVVHQR
jgi:competence protein ComEA